MQFLNHEITVINHLFWEAEFKFTSLITARPVESTILK